jgi:hypothetical protein
VRPRIRELLTETLRLLQQVQLEDLPMVVESLVENFEEDVIPVAESIVAELVSFLVECLIYFSVSDPRFQPFDGN